MSTIGIKKVDGLCSVPGSKIIVVGSLNMDLVASAPRLPACGETVVGIDFFTCPGGKGANQAYAAAHLGGSVAMIGAVGGDAHGASLISQLAKVGCAVDHIISVDAPTGVALIGLSRSGDNSIIVIPGANAQLDAARACEALRQVVLRRGDLLLLQLESDVAALIETAMYARERGAQIILDPAPAPASLPPDLLRTVDIITPNESELCVLAGKQAQALTITDAAGLARRLNSDGAVVVKLGSRGCLIVQGDRDIHVPAPRVNAVDTTGAGDVFNGALAVALAADHDLTTACRFAVRAAAISVTRLGAQLSAPSALECSLDPDRATIISTGRDGGNR